jgi:hypothetical protein
MPLRDFVCKQCQAGQERFYWATEGPPTCTCGGELEMQELSVGGAHRYLGSVFPYVCTHLDGKGTPISVESLPHLRRLEKQLGVVVHAFSQDSVDSARDLPRFRG